MKIRVATYNVHKCRGLDRRVQPARIANVLRELDADVVALQEVVSAPGIQAFDQARFLAAELGLHSCMGENRRLYGGAYGNLVLSQFPIRSVFNHDITIGKREQRGCLQADIDIEGTTLHIFNVHLGTSFVERRHQARKLVSSGILLDARLRGKKLVLGDFNEVTQGLASRSLGAHFQSLDIKSHLRRSRTYPGVFPFLHLDHMYFDSTLTVERAFLHSSRTALIASDHLPLVADFHLDVSPRSESRRREDSCMMRTRR
ncbi:MAG: endonuclease/exonuclease/phosphatase family protein [Acidobacteriaceae bacterium]|nr:endonuclease/exonuclease/phosphatase family protein [Acidobacteriaceae bacterium]